MRSRGRQTATNLHRPAKNLGNALLALPPNAVRSLALLSILLVACTSEPPRIGPLPTVVEQVATTSATSTPAPIDTATTTIAMAPSIDAAPPAPMEPAVPWINGLPRFDGMHGPSSAVVVPGFIRFAVTGDLEQATRAWIDRVKRGGARMLAEHRGYSWRSYSFEVASGARGNVVLTSAATAGELDGAVGQARHPPAKLLDACVLVPEKQYVVNVSSTGIDQHGREHTGKITHGVETMFFWDLDGDGQLDALAPVSGAANQCPWEVEYEVYLMRGVCGHDMGRVGPGYLAVPESGMGLPMTGLLPLTFTSEWSALGQAGIPVHSTRTTSFVFSATRYRKTADKTTEGVCHHCARSTTCRIQP